VSAKMKQLIEEIKELTAQERALVAHCLISSLENKQDEDVEAAWAELAEKRYKELESGAVKAITWGKIKKGIKG
jgi:putative addiction module component (TIGR02574 family)